MHPDLDRLIRLQRLDTFADGARRTIASLPERIHALDDRLATARAALDTAKQRQTDGQAARRAAEKDLAAIQTRLAKYRDQLMEVKTNREYQAMQKEIEVAQLEVRRLEDRILERMIEADELTAGVKTAEEALSADQAAIAAERQKLESEARGLEAELDRMAGERDALVREVPTSLMDTYALLVGRRGSAVAEARGGLCSACHVRLRIQVYNDLRRNDAIIHCESCQRVLFYVADAAQPPQAPTAAS